MIRRVVAPVVADLLAVLVFAAVGRRAHGEDPTGLLVTWAPFAAGTLVGALAAHLSGRRLRTPAAGAIIVLATVLIGMVLRVVTGAGTALTFVLVALVVLSAFLIGWRAVLALVLRRRARSS
jgi:peptidoglycan/LPS O-acetylase OafA/YrhL